MESPWIETIEQLEEFIELSEEERGFFKDSKTHLPMRISPYWMEQILKEGGEIFRRQAIPTFHEGHFKYYETLDPLGDRDLSPMSRLVHRYKDRVLFLVSQQCAVYCRHCFRRYLTGTNGHGLTEKEIEEIMEYLKSHGEVHELILSGGDPLLIAPESLKLIISGLNQLNRPILLRVGTRAPITNPRGIDPSLIRILASYNHTWLVLQVNHRNELTQEVNRLLRKIKSASIPMLNQSVLLKGINDDIKSLKELCYGLLEQGVKPYYIFQGDLARGTSHFRVSMKRCLELQEALRREVSGMAMPRFAVDLPGGGKIPLTEERLISVDSQGYLFRTLDDKEIYYPLEDEHDR